MRLIQSRFGDSTEARHHALAERLKASVDYEYSLGLIMGRELTFGAPSNKVMELRRRIQTEDAKWRLR